MLPVRTPYGKPCANTSARLRRGDVTLIALDLAAVPV
jgi:hypothetical protein